MPEDFLMKDCTVERLLSYGEVRTIETADECKGCNHLDIFHSDEYGCFVGECDCERDYRSCQQLLEQTDTTIHAL